MYTKDRLAQQKLWEDAAASERQDALHRFLGNQKDTQHRAEMTYHQNALNETNRHNTAVEKIGQQNAQTLESFRADQGVKMDDDVRRDKLKILLGGGGAGLDGKPLSNEAQKTSNLIDTARQNLNKTEELARTHPWTAAAEQFLPSFVINRVGGTLKDVADTKAATKEALQNVYTGAAASGEQVPSFQGFSGPGALDILRGKTEQDSGVRDSLNTLQQGYARQQKQLSPEMLKAAGLERDPVAQQALQMQEQAAAQRQNERLSKLPPEDQEAYKYIKSTPPDDPKAAQIRQRLIRRHGNIF